MALPADVCPVLVPGIRIETLPLSPTEGFVLSRINGIASVHEIAMATGLTLEQVEAALRKLQELGAVEFQKVQAAPPRAKSAAASATLKTPGLPQTDYLLRRLELMFKTLGQQDYYQLLGIERGATPDEIKAAFAALTRELHPDHVQKLGDTAKEMAETVFARVSEAYDVLKDPEKRRHYDDSLLPARAMRPKANPTPPPKKTLVADAKRLVELAEQELSLGNYQSAWRSLQIACALDPNNPDLAAHTAFVASLPEMSAALEKLTAEGVVSTDPNRQKLIEALLAKIRAAKDQFPPNEELWQRMVRFLTLYDSETKLAREVGERLARRYSKASSYVLLARIAERDLQWGEARRYYERALALDANCKPAQEGLAKLPRSTQR